MLKNYLASSTLAKSMTKYVNKKKLLTTRVEEATLEEFGAVSLLRGASMSSILHQYVIKTIREEKTKSPQEFAEALERVREESGVIEAPPAASKNADLSFEEQALEKPKKPREGVKPSNLVLRQIPITKLTPERRATEENEKSENGKRKTG